MHARTYEGLKIYIRCSGGSEYNRRSIRWTAVTESTNCRTLTNTNPRIILSAEVSFSAPHLSQEGINDVGDTQPVQWVQYQPAYKAYSN